MSTKRSKRVLVKLAEECGELTQIAMKTLQYGPESDDCGKPPKKNRKLLTEEAGDVMACITRLIELGVLDADEVMARADEKAAKHKEQGR
ncbi:MazG nucleotide pyrophosphohydrolase domain-containing protein [Escherichia coli]|uniref:MazG nucleotide pyrophosphohydrolase domain-containing protein n=1 Tax=Escherichia coli TaxID=562 RepID=UPI00307A312C